MACRIAVGRRSGALTSIWLENEHLLVEVLPELGGKIQRLVDKARDRDVLWHAPGITPHRAPLHADFDDHWSGGWDEIFPCGVPTENRHAEQLPHMGELWTGAATWTIVDGGPGCVELILDQKTPITPARWTRRLSLQAGSRVLDISYRLEHIGQRPFDFNWGLHPVQEISEATRLDIPALRGEVDDSGGGLLGATGETYEWPHLGSLDLRRALPPSADCYALHYLTELREGWVAATDTNTKRGFGLVFDRQIFPTVWLWLVYGGWRDYYQAIMEPWTGHPSSLARAVENGHARTLSPGEMLETKVSAVVYGGVESVSCLEADGSVVP